jgi:hypothetical protein
MDEMPVAKAMLFAGLFFMGLKAPAPSVLFMEMKVLLSPFCSGTARFSSWGAEGDFGGWVGA